jgi:hypothetical protein
MPTTMTMAGMASGRRHRNSMTWRMRGTRTIVQTIVGTSRRSIPRTVRTAISSEVVMPPTRFWSDRIAAYESRLRLP